MKTLFLSALMMGFAAVSFAGNPKGESKTTESATTTGTKATTTFVDLYWFETDETGSVLANSSGLPAAEEPSAPPCDNPIPSDLCARGFTESETTVSGGQRLPNIPISSGEAAYKED